MSTRVLPAGHHGPFIRRLATRDFDGRLGAPASTSSSRRAGPSASSRSPKGVCKQPLPGAPFPLRSVLVLRKCSAQADRVSLPSPLIEPGVVRLSRGVAGALVQPSGRSPCQATLSRGQRRPMVCTMYPEHPKLAPALVRHLQRLGAWDPTAVPQVPLAPWRAAADGVGCGLRGGRAKPRCIEQWRSTRLFTQPARHHPQVPQLSAGLRRQGKNADETVEPYRVVFGVNRFPPSSPM